MCINYINYKSDISYINYIFRFWTIQDHFTICSKARQAWLGLVGGARLVSGRGKKANSTSRCSYVLICEDVRIFWLNWIGVKGGLHHHKYSLTHVSCLRLLVLVPWYVVNVPTKFHCLLVSFCVVLCLPPRHLGLYQTARKTGSFLHVAFFFKLGLFGEFKAVFSPKAKKCVWYFNIQPTQVGVGMWIKGLPILDWHQIGTKQVASKTAKVPPHVRG